MKYSSFNWVSQGKRGWIFGPFRRRLLTVTWERLRDVPAFGGCECGWQPRLGLIGGETLTEHQRWCSIHANLT